MQGHARIAPSSLSLTIACNASLQLRESVPPLPPTEDEAEGTAAHWVARRYLAGHGAELPVNAKFISEGKEWKVTHDMHAGAVLYTRALGGVHPEMHIEESVAIPRIHSDCWGTPDGWRFFADARNAYDFCPEGIPRDRFDMGFIKLIRCGDYKFGHRFVEVFENVQLSAYVAGIMDRLEVHDMDPDLYVELVLVQPRCHHKDGPVRIWRTRAINLRNTIIAANDAAERATIPLSDRLFAPKAITGNHCLDCSARHVCVALQRNVGRIVAFTHTAEREELDPMSIGQELAIVQDAMKQLKARETGLAAQAEALLNGGKRVPFFGMEPGRSNRKYRDGVTADEIVSLGEFNGVDLRRKLKVDDIVVTPTQAIELGIDEEVMSAYASRPQAAKKLTRENLTQVRKVFTK